MFKYFVVVAASFALCHGAYVKRELDNAVLEPESEGTHSSYSNFGGHHGHASFDTHQFDNVGRGGSGAELSSLAHSSAVHANNAVQNQATAGHQAAFGVKSSLASAAQGAAQAAQAAVIGKQAIVQTFKNQLNDAQQQLQFEIAQYEQNQNAAQSAEESAHQAQVQVNTLTAALAAAQSTAQHASQAASNAASAAAAQHGMIVEAKQRVALTLSQLQSAISDLQDTEEAAHKASSSAKAAQSNAAAAGAAVLAAGSKRGHSGHGYSHHH